MLELQANSPVLARMCCSKEGFTTVGASSYDIKCTACVQCSVSGHFTNAAARGITASLPSQSWGQGWLGRETFGCNWAGNGKKAGVGKRQEGINPVAVARTGSYPFHFKPPHPFSFLSNVCTSSSCSWVTTTHAACSMHLFHCIGIAGRGIGLWARTILFT